MTTISLLRGGLSLALGGWLLLGLMGCACCGHHTEQDYGRSVANNLAAQVVNPEAGRTAQVTAGQSPEAAANAYGKYNKSFTPEEKKPLLKITTEK
jgi:hypothetical protein